MYNFERKDIFGAIGESNAERLQYYHVFKNDKNFELAQKIIRETNTLSAEEIEEIRAKHEDNNEILNLLMHCANISDESRIKLITYRANNRIGDSDIPRQALLCANKNFIKKYAMELTNAFYFPHIEGMNYNLIIGSLKFDKNEGRFYENVLTLLEEVFNPETTMRGITVDSSLLNIFSFIKPYSYAEKDGMSTVAVKNVSQTVLEKRLDNIIENIKKIPEYTSYNVAKSSVLGTALRNIIENPNISTSYRNELFTVEDIKIDMHAWGSSTPRDIIDNIYPLLMEYIEKEERYYDINNILGTMIKNEVLSLPQQYDLVDRIASYIKSKKTGTDFTTVLEKLVITPKEIDETLMKKIAGIQSLAVQKNLLRNPKVCERIAPFIYEEYKKKGIVKSNIKYLDMFSFCCLHTRLTDKHYEQIASPCDDLKRDKNFAMLDYNLAISCKTPINILWEHADKYPYRIETRVAIFCNINDISPEDCGLLQHLCFFGRHEAYDKNFAELAETLTNNIGEPLVVNFLSYMQAIGETLEKKTPSTSREDFSKFEDLKNKYITMRECDCKLSEYYKAIGNQVLSDKKKINDVFDEIQSNYQHSDNFYRYIKQILDYTPTMMECQKRISQQEEEKTNNEKEISR